MIDYEKIITRWQNAVAQYCSRRGIPNMELKNLRMGAVLDYNMYSVYTKAAQAVEMYRKTPSSSVYARDMIDAIKAWYALSADSKFQKYSMQMMPTALFARYIQRTK